MIQLDFIKEGGDQMEDKQNMIVSLLSAARWLISGVHHLASIGLYEKEPYHIHQCIISLKIVQERLKEALIKLNHKGGE